MSDRSNIEEPATARDILFDWLPYLGLLLLMTLPYIRLTHQTENTIRDTERLKKDIKDFRSEYITLKSEVMIESTESKVAEKLREKGLKSLEKPPYELKIQ
jgi:hypothetical protein